MRPKITVKGREGRTLWKPTTLRDLGRHEEDLERTLTETPELLCLETRRSGIRGPFRVFNQLALGTPLGREIYPDIMLLSASGDIIVVEVKLFANPELRDRRVIAQIIEYVSSLSALDEAGMARLFGRDTTDWHELIRSHFPEEDDPDELADVLLSNARDGDVHIVIACDKAPAGLNEMARSVSAQSHLGFSLDVVEVTPYIAVEGTADNVMFVPNVRLSTEIVARTAVSVSYETGSGQPGVKVETTGVEEIEENLDAVRGGGRLSKARNWSDQEIEDAVMEKSDPTVYELFRFAREEGFEGRIQGGAKRVSAGFGFYMGVPRQDGSVAPYQVFTWVDGRRKLIVYMNWESVGLPSAAITAYRNDLKALFGSVMERPEPNILLAEVGDNIDAFESAVRQLQAAALER